MKNDYLEKRELPILFRGEQVRAIWERRKSQTRRVIKLAEFQRSTTPGFDWAWRDSQWRWNEVSTDWLIKRYCPYGKPGDRLWPRETYVLERDDLECGAPVIPTDRPHFHNPGGKNDFDNEYFLFPHYRATDPMPELVDEDDYENESGCKWRPSIFMPRWASRLLLENTGVRVQRVQEISEEDAIAEGIKVLPLQDATDPSAWWESSPGVNQGRTPKISYARLWDSINAKPKPVKVKASGGKWVLDHYVSYPWEDIRETREYRGLPWLVMGNPYVWGISFMEIWRAGESPLPPLSADAEGGRMKECRNGF